MSFLLVLLSPAHADNILFLNVGAASGGYSGEYTAQVLADAGHTVTSVRVGSTAGPSEPSDYLVADHGYDQVWIFNASGANGSTLASSLGVLEDFHAAHPQLILDSRSYGLNYAAGGDSVENSWAVNEAAALSQAGGGMWFGGDHHGWNNAIDKVMADFGVDPWVGEYSGAIDWAEAGSPIWELQNTVDPMSLWVGTVASVPTGVFTTPGGRLELFGIVGSGTETYISTTLTSDVLDADGDGWSPSQGDCDDTDELISPEAEETWYDGVDSDCAGDDDYDQDGDGWALDQDCDDLDAEINPDAVEIWYDGVDSDCGGDDDYDQDGDGWALDQDCDDMNEQMNPDASEVWYDGVDSDCAGDDDDDQDGDGWGVDQDCDDLDPLVFPGSDRRSGQSHLLSVHLAAMFGDVRSL